MVKFTSTITMLWLLLSLVGCQNASQGDNPAHPVEGKTTAAEEPGFDWVVDTFADLRVLRYQIPGWDSLTLKQKKYVYYLTEAGYMGRDIMYDMNYRHNLKIRRTLEHVYRNYKGDKSSKEWRAFVVYLKRIWFSNGIHHHYSMDKFVPGFSREWLEKVLAVTGKYLHPEVLDLMYDPELDTKKVNLDPNVDLVYNSAVNFYTPNLRQKDVEDFYKKMIDKNDPKPISYGLNSQLMRRPDGKLEERVWKLHEMYSQAIEKIISNLKKAQEFAENAKQAEALSTLIEYYTTGDLKTWDKYNIQWVQATGGDVDYINSFIEVYNDPLGYKGSYESIVEIKDFEASKRMKVLGENAQWFEDHSSILPQHKKKKVVGVTYTVVNVAGESGDASPSTPIGVNLPNANWIRQQYGSKSVSLGNLIEAYHNAGGKGMLKEFANDEEEIRLSEKYGNIADKVSTALHEVIGHASGKINPGVGTPKETLKNYASTLEEARADLVALYFIMDPQLVQLGIIPSTDAGKAEYDGYISNGLMKQLRRIKPGKNIEEAHMRNRQLIAKWALEKGAKDGVIIREERDGKTYFDIKDYGKLRELFGRLLREIQRIKSEGDYQAGHDLVENYGVQVDKELHKEVLERVAKLHIKPYSGFVNPVLTPVKDKDGYITDILLVQPKDFATQMLDYADRYTTLPDDNQL